MEYAHYIEDSGRYLLDLINDLLDISKIEAGEYRLKKESFDLNAVVDDCVNLMRQKAATNGVNLATKARDGQPPLLADRRAVKQMLLNLLSNALKFTPKDGAIEVSVENSGGFHVITVSDTGPGIPTDEIRFLLDPFREARFSPQVSGEGSGLGLAITNSLVALHGGMLAIDGNGDTGTSVTISLPGTGIAGR